MTRDEHLKWAKGQAIRELDRGEPEAAYRNFMSDLNKHEELRDEMIADAPGFLAGQGLPDPYMRIWILGFE